MSEEKSDMKDMLRLSGEIYQDKMPFDRLPGIKVEKVEIDDVLILDVQVFCA